MISFDSTRCMYCGGCVSSCPVDALWLAETRLEVSEECIDCGDCTSACPVGALYFPGAQPASASLRLRPQYDVIVVGAGPGGSIAARTAAESGLSVLLLEKRQEIGSPVRCAEGVGHEQLAAFIEPDRRWIAAEIRRAEITSIAGGMTNRLKAEGGLGYVLERRIFDRRLAEQAAQAGADVRVKTSVTGLLRENGAVRGVKIQAGSGSSDLEIGARVVIAADGIEAQTGRRAGLRLGLPLADTMVCAQYLLAGVEIDPACNAYTISYEIAPGGYAWIFPKGEGRANVGLGVQADLYEPAQGTVLNLLTRFIESQPGLAQGSPVTLITGNVPVSCGVERMVTHGLMVVGDAAQQVDPLTGGGILNAMTAGKLAAAAAVEAIARGDTCAGSLKRYEEQWAQSTGRKNQRNYRLRMRFPPARRADERFVQAFALAAGG